LQRVERALLFGIVAIPLVITPNLTIDAVNLGKFTLYFLLSFITMYFSFALLRWNLRSKEIALIGVTLFLGLTMPLALSGANLDQQLFGSAGRNLGLFTHLSNFFVFLWGITLAKRISKVFLIRCFGITSVISLTYGIAQSLGWDFVPWKYPHIFGTLGNTNFFGTHTAIIFSMTLGLVLTPYLSRKYWAYISYILISSLYLTLKTEAFQGIVIIGVSTTLSLFIFLRRSGARKSSLVFLLFAISAGVISFLGIFGLGPLASTLFGEFRTLKIRFYFWQAAIKMFMSSPLYGVGLDSYGDWYQVSRPDAAYFGGDFGEFADSAHNLFLDYLATGGVSLFLFAVIFSFFVFRASFRIIYGEANGKSSELMPYVLGFFGFWLYSLVSPINIGISVWGFLFAGLTLGSEIDLRERTKIGTSQKNRVPRKTIIAIYTITTLTVSVLAIAPSLKEYRVIRAQKSGNVKNFVESINLFPQDANTLRNGINILENAGYYGPSSKLALRGIQEFPRNYNLIELTSNLKALDSSIRQSLRSQLEKIDPPRLLDRS